MVADVLILLGLHFYGVSLEKEKHQPFDDHKDKASHEHEKESAENVVNNPPKRNVSSNTVPPDKKKS